MQNRKLFAEKTILTY